VRLTLLILLAASCTIDPGPQLEPPQTGCTPDPAPFIAAGGVWDAYFDHYNCANGGCHDASNGHGFFRLSSVTGSLRPAV
jgi:hypothetical protein